MPVTSKGNGSTAKNLMKPIASDRGIIVGVTGGIACGKSTVSKLLSKKGAIPINSDEIGHQLLKRGSPVMSALLEAFGSDILDESGDVSRPKLGAIVFNDKAARERLNAIMHPPIVERSRAEANRLVTEAANCVVLIDAQLLIEANSQDTVDVIVVVTASTQTQLQRLLERAIEQNRPPSQAEAQARIDSQMPLSEKIKYADFVLENDGTLEELKQKVERLWHEILRLKAN